MIMEKEKNTNH